MNQHRNIFGSYFEFVVMISVVGVDNGSVQFLLSVLVARDAVALLVWLQDQMINSFPGILTGVVFLLDCWGQLYALCPFIWLVSPAWDAVELTLQGWLHFSVHGLRPYWFKSNYSCCSRTNAWKLRIHPRVPRRRLSAFGDFIIKANVLLLLVVTFMYW